MMSLENVFLTQAVDLNSEIDGDQLREILRMENNRCFSSQLIDELILRFGNHNLVSFRNFVKIWSYLRTRRLDFERYSCNGQLHLADFKTVLENIAQKQLHSEFIRRLDDFYRGQLTFDAMVHAVYHVKMITALDVPLSPRMLMKKFEEPVSNCTESAAILNEIQPSAPAEEIVPHIST